MLYNEIRKEIRKACRKDKANYIQAKCNVIDHHRERNNSRCMYAEIRSLSRRFQPSLKVIKDANERPLTETKDILERWKQYCENLYSSTNPTRRDEVENPEAHDDFDLEPLRSEVEKAVKEMRNGKSPGCDDIPAEMWKHTGQTGITLLHKLCVKIWRSGKWPEDWCRTIFIPIPKTGDFQQCKNHRTISLICHASKILLSIITNRLQNKLNEEISETQAGFRKGKGTREQIFNVRILLQKCREFHQDLYTCFIDYSKAFDCVIHEQLWKFMKEMGMPMRATFLLQTLYSSQQSCVRVKDGSSEWFKVTKGVRQGCPVSPHLFNLYTEYIWREVEDCDTHSFDAVQIGGRTISELRYADDTSLFSSTPEGLSELILRDQQVSAKYGLCINEKKTKVMKLDRASEELNIILNGQVLETVDNFDYLGARIMNDCNDTTDIKRRIAIATSALKKLLPLWKHASKQVKLKVLRSCIFPIATYGAETWTIKCTDERRLRAFENTCYRKILRVPWTRRRTNESVRLELGITTDWLMNFIHRQKLKFFGHIKRHDSLEKSLLEGNTNGRRSRGRQRRRWEDGITGALNLTIAGAGRLAQDRNGYRTAVIAATS